jgi:acyl-coenzyme A thioesterase PaaI-like protein
MSGQGWIKKWNLGAKLLRMGMNCWPPFFGAGIHIMHWTDDFRNVRVRMKMHWYNKNYMGTHFGGTLFSMTDPFFMIMTAENLGHAYVVWDKSATIRFVKPGRGTVYAEFKLEQSFLDDVIAQTSKGEKYEPSMRVDVTDESGDVVATIEKQLYIRKARLKSERAAAKGEMKQAA